MAVELTLVPNKTTLSGTEELFLNDNGLPKDITTAALSAYFQSIATAVANSKTATLTAFNTATSNLNTLNTNLNLAKTALDTTNNNKALAAKLLNNITNSSAGLDEINKKLYNVHSGSNIRDVLVYDTTKDSDGGDWTDKCDNNSWVNEPLSGTWLGIFPNELAARGNNLFTNPEFPNGLADLGPNSGLTVTTFPGLINNTGLNFTNNSYGYIVLSNVFSGSWSFRCLVRMSDNSAPMFNSSDGSVSLNDFAIIVNGNIVNPLTYVVTKVSEGLYSVACTGNGGTGNGNVGICKYTGNSTKTFKVSGYDFQTVALNAMPAYVETGSLINAYYQNSTDNRFYRLGEKYGKQYVTYRGNKARFPKVVGIVFDYNSVTVSTDVIIYDLTDPTFPMWMVLRSFYDHANWGGKLHATQGKLLITIQSTNPAYAGNGLYIYDFPSAIYNAITLGGGGSNTAGKKINFTSTSAGLNTNNTTTYYYGEIYRDSVLSGVSYTVNHISSIVMPGAPVDSFSNLELPTFVFSTTGGISVWNPNGTVNYFSDLGLPNNRSYENAYLDRYDRLIGYSSANGSIQIFKNASVAGKIGPDNTYGYSGGYYPFTAGPVGYISSIAKNSNTISVANKTFVSQILENTAYPSQGIINHICDRYSSGMIVGDAKRNYLSEIISESVVNGIPVLKNTDWTTGWTDIDSRVTLTPTTYTWNGPAGGTNLAGGYTNYLNTSCLNKFIKLTYVISGYTGTGSCGIDGGILSNAPNDSTGVYSVDTKVSSNGTHTFFGYYRGGGNVDGRTLVILGRATNAFTLSNIQIEEVDAIHSAELCKYGTFGADTFGTTVPGWTSSSTWTSTATIVSNELRIAATVTSGRQQFGFPTLPGKYYQYSALIRRVSGTGAASMGLSDANGGNLDSPPVNTTTTNAIVSNVFLATATTSYIYIGAGAAGDVCAFNNISIKECVGNRVNNGIKRSLLTTNPIKKSPVATGAQLACFDAFSNTTYLTEGMYSSELDFGTGDMYSSAWVKIPKILPDSTTWCYSPELIANGNFLNALTGWTSAPTLTSTAAIVNNELVVTATANSGRQIYAFTTVVGKTYRYSATLRKNNGFAASIVQCTSTGSDIGTSQINTATTNANVSNTFIASATTSYIALGCDAVGNSCVFSNVSVKETGYGIGKPEVITDMSLFSVPLNANSSVSGNANQVVLTATGSGTIGVRANTATVAKGYTSYEVTISWTGNTNGRNIYVDLGSGSPVSSSFGTGVTGTAVMRVAATPTNGQSIQYPILYFVGGVTGDSITFTQCSCKEVNPLPIYERKFSSGASFNLGVLPGGYLTYNIVDSGGNWRTISTLGNYAFNLGTWNKVETTYTGGTLSLIVNGDLIAFTPGTALLTLNNSNAILTVGNNYLGNTAFPGAIALVNLSATIPSIDHSKWMYNEEKEMFRSNTKVAFPANSTNIVNSYYNDHNNTWTFTQAYNKVVYRGLVCIATESITPAYYTRVASGNHCELVSKMGTGGSIDITVGKLHLPIEFNRRRNGTNKYIRQVFSYTTTAAQAITPSYTLPAGWNVFFVFNNGAPKRIGTTKDYTVSFNGLYEVVTLNTAPAANTWIQLEATKG